MWDSQTVCEQSKVCTKIRNPRGMGRYCCQWIACGREEKEETGQTKTNQTRKQTKPGQTTCFRWDPKTSCKRDTKPQLICDTQFYQ